MTLHFTNSNAPIPLADELKSTFHIIAPANTDIWAKPPNTVRFNAPYLHRIDAMTRFRRARVHVKGEWGLLYDQGGLLITMHDVSGSCERKWVKTGIEFVNGKPHVSTVAKDKWADWSLLPVPESNVAAGGPDGKDIGVTVEMVREQDGSLWIYLIDAEGVKTPIREVTWAFEKEDMVDCWIGVYAARPNKNTTEMLEVKFSQWELDIAD
ncbi:hypothetical protein VTO42DRAFT_2140 [Malbranchea cinnamomea]